MSTYKMDQPMSWEAFLGMPEDLQKQYLGGLIDTYDATDEMLGEMFRVHRLTVGKVRRRLGTSAGKDCRKRLSAAHQEIRNAKWATFCGGVVGGGDVQVEPENAAKEDPAAETVPTAELVPVSADEPDVKRAMTEKQQLPMDLTELRAVFSGYFKPEDFLAWISRLPVPDGEVRIKVEVERV